MYPIIRSTNVFKQSFSAWKKILHIIWVNGFSAVAQLFYDAAPRIVEKTYGLLRKTTTKPENELMSLLRALISSVPQKFVHSHENCYLN